MLREISWEGHVIRVLTAAFCLANFEVAMAQILAPEEIDYFEFPLAPGSLCMEGRRLPEFLGTLPSSVVPITTDTITPCPDRAIGVNFQSGLENFLEIESRRYNITTTIPQYSVGGSTDFRTVVRASQYLTEEITPQNIIFQAERLKLAFSGMLTEISSYSEVTYCGIDEILPGVSIPSLCLDFQLIAHTSVEGPLSFDKILEIPDGYWKRIIGTFDPGYYGPYQNDVVDLQDDLGAILLKVEVSNVAVNRSSYANGYEDVKAWLPMFFYDNSADEYLILSAMSEIVAKLAKTLEVGV